MTSACDAVLALSAIGVYSGDIKPSNFREDKRGNLKMVDLSGSAFPRELLGNSIAAYLKSMDSVSSAMTKGAYTLAYAAPEQLLNRDGKLTPQISVYRLSAMLYHMATGEMLQGILQDPPSALNRLKSVFLKGLASKPEDRCQSVEALKALLVEALTPRRWDSDNLLPAITKESVPVDAASRKKLQQAIAIENICKQIQTVKPSEFTLTKDENGETYYSLIASRYNANIEFSLDGDGNSCGVLRLTGKDSDTEMYRLFLGKDDLQKLSKAIQRREDDLVISPLVQAHAVALGRSPKFLESAGVEFKDDAKYAVVNWKLLQSDFVYTLPANSLGFNIEEPSMTVSVDLTKQRFLSDAALERIDAQFKSLGYESHFDDKTRILSGVAHLAAVKQLEPLIQARVTQPVQTKPFDQEQLSPTETLAAVLSLSTQTTVNENQLLAAVVSVGNSVVTETNIKALLAAAAAHPFLAEHIVPSLAAARDKELISKVGLEIATILIPLIESAKGWQFLKNLSPEDRKSVCGNVKYLSSDEIFKLSQSEILPYNNDEVKLQKFRWLTEDFKFSELALRCLQLDYNNPVLLAYAGQQDFSDGQVDWAIANIATAERRGKIPLWETSEPNIARFRSQLVKRNVVALLPVEGWYNQEHGKGFWISELNFTDIKLALNNPAVAEKFPTFFGRVHPRSGPQVMELLTGNSETDTFKTLRSLEIAARFVQPKESPVIVPDIILDVCLATKHRALLLASLPVVTLFAAPAMHDKYLGDFLQLLAKHHKTDVPLAKALLEGIQKLGSISKVNGEIAAEQLNQIYGGFRVFTPEWYPKALVTSTLTFLTKRP